MKIKKGKKTVKRTIERTNGWMDGLKDKLRTLTVVLKEKLTLLKQSWFKSRHRDFDQRTMKRKGRPNEGANERTTNGQRDGWLDAWIDDVTKFILS